MEACKSFGVKASADDIDWDVYADEPMRVYAVDARGRHVWGSAAPLIRMFIDAGWKHSLHLKMLGLPDGKPLLPEKVEPAWKLWKPKDLRRPSTWTWPPT